MSIKDLFELAKKKLGMDSVKDSVKTFENAEEREKSEDETRSKGKSNKTSFFSAISDARKMTEEARKAKEALLEKEEALEYLTKIHKAFGFSKDQYDDAVRQTTDARTISEAAEKASKDAWKEVREVGWNKTQKGLKVAGITTAVAVTLPITITAGVVYVGGKAIVKGTNNAHLELMKGALKDKEDSKATKGEEKEYLETTKKAELKDEIEKKEAEIAKIKEEIDQKRNKDIKIKDVLKIKGIFSLVKDAGNLLELGRKLNLLENDLRDIKMRETENNVAISILKTDIETLTKEINDLTTKIDNKEIKLGKKQGKTATKEDKNPDESKSENKSEDDTRNSDEVKVEIKEKEPTLDEKKQQVVGDCKKVNELIDKIDEMFNKATVKGDIDFDLIQSLEANLNDLQSKNANLKLDEVNAIFDKCERLDNEWSNKITLISN